MVVQQVGTKNFKINQLGRFSLSNIFTLSYFLA